MSTEEREILKHIQEGNFQSQRPPERIMELQSAAEKTFKKDRRPNIRIPSRDFEGLQRRALEESAPYRTLLSSILHSYVPGGLQDIAAKKSRQQRRFAPGPANARPS
jgi:predicted DNA binding CopG/RHH family protein